MSGEINLTNLLKSLTAKLAAGTYVFATLAADEIPAGIATAMTFQEAEGTTLILLQSQAEAHKIAHEFPCRMITLTVHSSLEAVGFIAHIATEFAKHNMGVNPVAGFYHDHLFVPVGREQYALQVLRQIASDAQNP